MNLSKPFGRSAPETSEVEVRGSIREFTHGRAVFRQGENGDGEMSVTELGRLLRHVSSNSRSEIDTLIDDLQTLREKLENDSQRLQDNISEYASLSEQIMQVTKDISERTRRLPDAQEPGA
jgi:methyl-accepting chemotaxis protein